MVSWYIYTYNLGTQKHPNEQKKTEKKPQNQNNNQKFKQPKKRTKKEELKTQENKLQFWLLSNNIIYSESW